MAVVRDQCWSLRSGGNDLELLLKPFDLVLKPEQACQHLAAYFILMSGKRRGPDTSHNCWLRGGVAGIGSPTEGYFTDIHEGELVVGCDLLKDGPLQLGLPQPRDEFLSQGN